MCERSRRRDTELPLLSRISAALGREYPHIRVGNVAREDLQHTPPARAFSSISLLLSFRPPLNKQPTIEILWRAKLKCLARAYISRIAGHKFPATRKCVQRYDTIINCCLIIETLRCTLTFNGCLKKTASQIYFKYIQISSKFKLINC